MSPAPSVRLGVSLLSLSAALAFNAPAQDCEVRTILSPTNVVDKGKFGSAVAYGDFDQNGMQELLVGMPGYKGSGTDKVGCIYLFDAPAFALHGEYANPIPVLDDEFGFAVATGDFDRDTYLDFAVGAPGRDNAAMSYTDSGAVFVYYGPDFGTWIQIDGLSNGGRFGSALAAGVISDKVPGAALVIGAPKVTVSALASVGETYVFVDASRTWSMVAALGVTAPAGNEQFGTALAISDNDGDGKNDLAVGAPFSTVNAITNAGFVWWFKGHVTDLQAGQRIDPPTAEAKGRFGYSFAYGNLVNNDSKQDLVIGAPGITDSGLKNSGVIYICDGADVSVAIRKASYSPEGGGFYGTGVLAGDIDGDGVWDVAASEPEAAENGKNRTGSITAWLGPSFMTSLAVLPEGEAEDIGNFGAALAAIDSNDDGIAEFAVGMPGRDISGLDKVGKAIVVDLSVDLPFVEYSNGMSGSGVSPPTLSGSGSGIGGAIDALSVAGALPGTLGLLLVGVDRVFLDLPGDGILLTYYQSVFPFSADGAGNFSLQYMVPTFPVCVPFFLQVFLEDPAYLYGYRHTAGLQLTIQQ